MTWIEQFHWLTAVTTLQIYVMYCYVLRCKWCWRQHGDCGFDWIHNVCSVFGPARQQLLHVDCHSHVTIIHSILLSSLTWLKWAPSISHLFCQIWGHRVQQMERFWPHCGWSKGFALLHWVRIDESNRSVWILESRLTPGSSSFIQNSDLLPVHTRTCLTFNRLFWTWLCKRVLKPAFLNFDCRVLCLAKLGFHGFIMESSMVGPGTCW